MAMDYDPSGIYGASPYQPGRLFQRNASTPISPMGAAPAGMDPNAPAPGQAGQIPPELVQAMLAMQGNRSTDQGIARQMAQAQALQDRATGGVSSISPGGGRVGAPNVMGALANVYAGYKGGQMMDDANVQQQNANVQRQDAMRRYFEALGGNRSAPSLGAGRDTYGTSSGE